MTMLFVKRSFTSRKHKIYFNKNASIAILDKAFIICLMLRSGLGKAQVLHPASPQSLSLEVKTVGAGA